ncbi:MAG: CDP-alcohol phosphatidyltransferase family protein [Candidatus Altiarchaeota archaeon]|nr:CDP-alcohol phosphatidyltransferase family protein [Candidatus Altiarchaeota archaeon]
MLSKYRPWWNDLTARIFGPWSKWTSPNQMTFLNLVSGALAGWFIYTDHFKLAALFVALSSIFDFIDGGIARGSDKGTKFGAVLDATFDRLSEGLVFIGLAFKSQLAIVALVISYAISHVGVKEPRAHKGIAERAERTFIICGFLFFNQIYYGLLLLIALLFPTLLIRLWSARKVNQA